MKSGNVTGVDRNILLSCPLQSGPEINSPRHGQSTLYSVSNFDPRIKLDHYRETPAKVRVASTFPFIHGHPVNMALPYRAKQIRI